jgi:SAM-dependent methyltransferase
MSSKYINLGCGPVYINTPAWINIDFNSDSPEVLKANLLKRLPLPSEDAELIYSSHFLEHIPKANVDAFLRECYRVLQPNGLLRLVLPDFEEMARTYLKLRESANHEQADFLMLEMIDQCVRNEPGGELGRFYTQLQNATSEQRDLVEFVLMRTGEDLRAVKKLATKKPGAYKIASWTLTAGRAKKRLQHVLRYIWLQIWLAGLPAAFRAQNISLAGVGERHHWLWDFHQLSELLESVGFVEIQRCSADSSSLADFPFYPLDLDTERRPRKGMESMYVEAKKPS